MKTKFMAAVAACRLKARAFARACLESKRNLYRLFRTAVAAIAVAVVIVPATILLGEDAFADGACAPSYRVSHSDSDCMHAWWDNTPPASSGVAGGATYGMRSYCSKYGDLEVNVEFAVWTDPEYTLSNPYKVRGKLTGPSDVRGIACCINESDLCYKQQVKKKNGKIKVWTGTGTTMKDKNVRTHAKRYAYCSENRNSIYCVNDPDGDAFIDPNNCGDHLCTAADCQTAFEASDAYEQCQSYGNTVVADPTYSISATDGSSQTCTVTANCRRNAEVTLVTGEVFQYTFQEKTISADVENIEDVVNCFPGVQLAVGAC